MATRVELADNEGNAIKGTNPLPVMAAGSRAAATSRSGTITLGGTAQDLMAANADRIGWEFQNQSSVDMYIRSKGSAGTTVATADQNSIRIPPGGYYDPPQVTVNALSIICATTGAAFFAKEW